LDVLYACWASFGLVWLAGAAWNARAGPRPVTRRRRSAALVVVGLLAWAVLRFLPRGARTWGTVDAWEVEAAGMVVLVAMTAATLWARGALGTMWSSAAVVKDHHALRTTGPYAIVRHPIYTGLLGMLGGTALIAGLGVWVVLVVAAACLFQVKLRAEERLLAATFGPAYGEYASRVPRLIPGTRLGCRR
jgi:protein-S-isoprenylcysteine O-methyltransferase Ste14